MLRATFEPEVHRPRTRSQGSVIALMTMLRAVRSWVPVPAQLSIQSRVKRPERKADHFPLISAEVKKEWRCTTIPPCPQRMCREVEHATKAHRGSYSSTLSLTSAIDRGGCSTPRPGRSTPGKDPVPIVQEAEWAAGPVWTGAKNLAPHRDSISGSSSP
jgi:hypothetical protein